MTHSRKFAQPLRFRTWLLVYLLADLDGCLLAEMALRAFRS